MKVGTVVCGRCGIPATTGHVCTTTTPREVRLPTCELCGAVSKAAAATTYGGKFYCDGKAGELHKRTKMEPRLFREVRR